MKIFISYRRVEDQKSNIVGVIHDNLSKAFGKSNVFLDRNDIHSGMDWRNKLEEELNNCQAMIVVIGPEWASLKSADGTPRLLNHKDVTRWEIETGIRRSKEEKLLLIPVLVLGASSPSAQDLPETLHPLLGKQWLILRNYPDFEHDMESLINDIRASQPFREDDIEVSEYEPKTIYITAGTFLMGSQPGENVPDYETPQHPVTLPAYRIGKYPVTNSEYEAYISETKGQVPSSKYWVGRKVRSGYEKYPVDGVTWVDAADYCQWLSEQTERHYTLPNEAQWEKACRGGHQNFKYPWGDIFDATRSNHACKELAPVDAYNPQNDYGCFDLVGNVRQWTCSLWGEKFIEPDLQFRYPWLDDRRNNMLANRQIRRTIRGSSFQEDILYLRCSSRNGQMPGDAGWPGAGIGFRVVMNLR